MNSSTGGLPPERSDRNNGGTNCLEGERLNSGAGEVNAVTDSTRPPPHSVEEAPYNPSSNQREHGLRGGHEANSSPSEPQATNFGRSLNYNPDVKKNPKAEIRELKKERLILRTELHQKEEEISSLQNNHEKEIRTLQQAAFRQMAEAAWVPEQDTAFQEELKDCNQKIWTWAKNHALKSFDRSIETHKDLLKDLSYTVRLNNGKFPKYFSKGKFAAQAPALLVASAISDEIYSRTICNPFLVFSIPFGDSKEPLVSKRLSEATVLEDVYNQLNKRNRSGANLWRAQLHRILFPKFPDAMHLEQQPRDEQIEKSLEAIIKFIVDEIESQPLTKLLRDTEDGGKTRRDELAKIVRQVVFLCTRLGTQRTNFRVERPGCLLGKGFRADSDNMEAHRLHRLGYDDTRLDGSKIGIVVHPAITAWGDNDGENYDSSRVLSKAVVWVEER